MEAHASGRNDKVMRCAVVGDGLLAVECAAMAAAAGLHVVAVASTSPQIIAESMARGLPTVSFDTHDELADELGGRDLDVLFCIAYLRLLPPAVLATARWCVNFHDGPLPTYAGLNVTTWAVYNGETSHAVTWHLMTDDVDAGDVVATAAVPIGPAETAFSLNARCYEAAIASFAVVVRALRHDGIDVTAASTAGRRVYRRRDRPLVVVDPRHPVTELERGIRALDVGTRIVNSVGAPRLLLGDEVVVPGAAVPAPGTAGAPPGTIVAVAADELRVSTVDGDVVLSRIVDSAGAPVAVDAALARNGLRAGDVLPAPASGLLDELAAADPQLAAAEPWWLEQLRGQTPADPRLLGAEPGGAWIEQPVAGAGGASAAELVGAVATWLGAVQGVDEVPVGCTDPSARRLLAALGSIAHAPVVRVDTTVATVGALCSDTGRRATAALDHGPFLADLIARDPQLRGVDLDPPVTVELDVAAAEPPARRGVLHVTQSAGGGDVRLVSRFDAGTTARIAAQLAVVLAGVRAAADTPLHDVSLLGEPDARLLATLDGPVRDLDRAATVDGQFRRQVASTPDAAAVSAGEHTVTYRQLAALVDTVATRLTAAGVAPGDTVAIGLPRGIEMVASVLAVLDRGATYLPLDPEYPERRRRLVLEDSGCRVLVAPTTVPSPAGEVSVVAVPAPLTATGDGSPPPPAPHSADDLAYLIYTSGSTGTPKGVLLEHGNVTNFFTAMDEVIVPEPPGVWLAVTSLSFDISVLELLWTLTRGYHVVVKADSGFSGGTVAAPAPRRAVSMSLFYFAAGTDQAADGYRLLLDSAAWADKRGFEAVWVPERHFHDFGAPYPNPSVVAAAVAAMTTRIAVRAGSVVLPLHSPVRVAEEWSVVDNLSGGRVGISFAPGWQADDFVLNPQGYAASRDSLPDQIDVVRALWRGETVRLPGPRGDVDVATMPRPLQPELPTWLTSAGSTTTFERAGRLGVHVLTHLLGQSVDQLAGSVDAYRRAWAAAGHDGAGHVTLMLHAFLDEDATWARAEARAPLKRYLASSVGLLRDVASAFPTFANASGDADAAFASLSDAEMDQLLDIAADRYLSTSGLFGDVDDAVRLVDRVGAAGVDEVACLIDFGISSATVLAALEQLGEVHDRIQRSCGDEGPAAAPGGDVASLVARHGVTHLQCTPSLASMLAADPADRRALGSIRHLLVGGEALTPTLATELRGLLPGRLTNMYGPTETTVWSLTHDVDDPVAGSVPIGTPITNTSLLVLDRHGRRLPPGAFGELHIGGAGVARGYHARAQITAERFVERPGIGRTYATGDIVRIDPPTGHLEFGGRVDDQVKIRGHRIELGEIESALQQLDAVQHAAVVVTGEAEPSLVAFASLQPAATTVGGDELRGQLGTILPAALVPSRVVLIDALPMTPNGKIDRPQLVSLSRRAPTPPATMPAPGGDDAETLVAGIWASALGRAVGLDDNFFDSGGHSLLAVTVHRRIVTATGADLALTDVFRYPTVRSFAAQLTARRTGDTSAPGGAEAPEQAPAAGTARGELRRRGRTRRQGGSS